MSTNHPGRTGVDDWHDCRPATPTDGCDPSSSIDERKCRDAGLAAQLDYTKEPSKELESAQEEYEKARKAYRDSRHDAATKVQGMKQDVKHLIERIRCLIEQDRVLRCLDQAFEQICEQLTCCEGPLGCPVGDVAFDIDVPASRQKLAHRIDRYTDEVAKAKASFAQLVAEPARLLERVDGVKADLDAVQAALNEDAAKVELKKQYVSVLVAGRKLGRIWNGYADATAYLDCLCRALTNWSNGVDAVSVLVGAEAVLECRKQSGDDWCARLEQDPVTEILLAYDRLCASDRPCDPAEPEAEPEEQPPGDCGCGCGKHGGGPGSSTAK